MAINKVQFTAEWTPENRHLATPTVTLAHKVACAALIILLGLLPLFALTAAVAYLMSWATGRLTNRIAQIKTLPSAQPPTAEQLQQRRQAKESFEALWKGPLGTFFEPLYQTIQTPDGVQLDAVWIRHKQASKNTPTLIYFNGNFQIYQQFPSWPFYKAIETQTPCHFVLFNYRGVDGSTGTVRSAKDLVLDGDSVVQWVRSAIGTLPENILFYGLSLGGAVALQTQALHPEELTGRHVNHNSFSSSSRIIEVLFNTWPLKQLAIWAFAWQGYSTDPAEAFRKLKGEKLVVVNPQDSVIPPTATLQTVVQHDNFFILEPKEEFRMRSEKEWRNHAAPLEWHEGAIEKIWNFLFERQDGEIASAG